MPANIASLPAAVAVVAQLATNESNASGIAVADAPGSGRGPFDALFRHLLVKQAAVDGDFGELILPTDAALENDAGASAGDLAALLPFLQAMGLMQATDASAPAEPFPAAEDALAVLAGPINVPAASLPAAANGAAISAVATALKDGTAADTTDAALAAHGAPAGDAPQTRDLSAGREFSTQLVAAIAASKEQPQAPGNTAAAVQQVIASASPQATPATVASSLSVAQPVGASGWSEEVGNRIVWMANRMESRAELVLTPPQMGRVEISLSITGEQATANFVSGNPAVREALEAALPRLREILADAGIQLGQAQVNAENARQSAQQEKNPDNSAFDRATASDNAVLHANSGSLPANAGLKTGRGLVDVFA